MKTPPSHPSDFFSGDTTTIVASQPPPPPVAHAPPTIPLYPTPSGQEVIPPFRQPRTRRQAAQQREMLNSEFVSDVMGLWKEQGEAVLRRAAFSDPMGFAKMVAGLMPKQTETLTDPLKEMADDELHDLLDRLRAVAARGSSQAPGPAGEGG